MSWERQAGKAAFSSNGPGELAAEADGEEETLSCYRSYCIFIIMLLWRQKLALSLLYSPLPYFTEEKT